MKKIDLKKFRSIAVGSLVVSPALITVAYAATCEECHNDWANCIGDASHAQGMCQQACETAADPDACRGGCDNAYVAAADGCFAALDSCTSDCTC